MTLRSIPPVNYFHNLDKLSSMRASDRANLRFVGSNIQNNDSQFKPHVILPDPIRDIYREAIKYLAKQLRELYQLSDDDDEKLFWQAKLKRITGEFNG